MSMTPSNSCVHTRTAEPMQQRQDREAPLKCLLSTNVACDLGAPDQGTMRIEESESLSCNPPPG